MPNWVRTKFELNGTKENLDAVLDKILSEDREYEGRKTFLFNNFYPMPEDLAIECGSTGMRGVKLYTKFYDFCITTGIFTEKEFSADPYCEKVKDAELKLRSFFEYDPAEMQLGKKYYLNKKKYGFETWYEWSIAHWGCKWDASTLDIDIDGGVARIEIETPWSPPLQAFMKMNEICKEHNVSFGGIFSDEDIYSVDGTGAFAFHPDGHCDIETGEGLGRQVWKDIIMDIWGVDMDEPADEEDDE